MKTVKILLCFTFITMIIGNVNSQNTNNLKMDSLIESYKSLTDKKNEYDIEFVENKNTLIFKFKTQNSEEIAYKVILTDIHPQGIFRYELDNKNFIRILSIDNGHRFIKDGFRVSHTTNIIDIELPKNIDLKKINRVIKDLKSILKKPVIESDEIIIVGPESKNEK
ncbi:hypothetical protein Q4Q34_04905 [Flavivirga abyssicola]|uniref:hypothetical protein n=1 Tax=Flavivirga abyssicola TaxID=3063533 RepID=UPI0026DFF040|nr:hypothetical protein [Flavivirga sp. MEBiC07777]WVK14366.1 hypothetical protein Q4Q34_04905 [Flavivirga sp. MEBiC07777]